MQVTGGSTDTDSISGKGKGWMAHVLMISSARACTEIWILNCYISWPEIAGGRGGGSSPLSWNHNNVHYADVLRIKNLGVFKNLHVLLYKRLNDTEKL